MKNLAKPLAVAVMVVSTATSATGWYLAAHRGRRRTLSHAASNQTAP